MEVWKKKGARGGRRPGCCYSSQYQGLIHLSARFSAACWLHAMLYVRRGTYL